MEFQLDLNKNPIMLLNNHHIEIHRDSDLTLISTDEASDPEVLERETILPPLNPAYKTQNFDTREETSEEEGEEVYFDSSSSGDPSSQLPVVETFKEQVTLETAVLTPLQPSTTQNDVSTPVFKRSFVRQKQIKELLNTENVYVKSLKDLKEIYLNGLLNSGTVPISIQVFRKKVDLLFKEHRTFYVGLKKIYQEWVSGSSSSITNWDSSYSLQSPEYSTFKPQFNDALYIEKIIDSISENSINVEAYCSYCRLQPKVLEFTSDKDIEKYRKQNQVVILNDYMVESQATETKFLDKGVDMSFDSVIQRPTRRSAIYKMIIEALLHKSADDFTDELKLKMKECIASIEKKCIQINTHLAKASKLNEKNNLMKGILKPYMEKYFEDYYLENLGDMHLVGGFATVWLDEDNVRGEYMGAILFDSHLMLMKVTKHQQHDIKFVIPLTSIFNIQRDDLGENGHLFTDYPFSFKIQFEESFCKYEIVSVLSTSEEKTTWIEELTSRLAFYRRNIPDYEFSYSDLKEISVTRSKIEYYNNNFIFNCSLPEGIKPFKQKGEDYFLTSTEYSFTVDHFIAEKNSHCSTEIKRARSYSRSQKSTFPVKKHHRVNVEKVLRRLWSTEKGIPIYLTELTRSISDFSLKKKLSVSTFTAAQSYQPPSSSAVLRTQSQAGKIHASQSLRSISFCKANAGSCSNRSNQLNIAASNEKSSSHSSGSIMDDNNSENVSLKSVASAKSQTTTNSKKQKSFSFRSMIRSISVRSGISDIYQKQE